MVNLESDDSVRQLVRSVQKRSARVYFHEPGTATAARRPTDGADAAGRRVDRIGTYKIASPIRDVDKATGRFDLDLS